jgi:putative oxidoreductase
MTDMVEVPPQRKHSGVARFINCLVHLCSIVPYSLAALVLRVVMARIFFVTGQAMIDGPKHPLKDIDYSLTLPTQVREETFRMFEAKLAGTPLSPTCAAYVVSYAEFILPILLVLGLATRFTALALIFLVIFIDQYLEPGTFWSLHIYWYAILLMLMSGGAGIVSVDYLIRRLYDR